MQKYENITHGNYSEIIIVDIYHTEDVISILI